MIWRKVLCWLGHEHKYTSSYVCDRCGKTSYGAYLDEIEKRNYKRKYVRELPVRSKEYMEMHPQEYKDPSVKWMRDKRNDPLLEISNHNG